MVIRSHTDRVRCLSTRLLQGRQSNQAVTYDTSPGVTETPFLVPIVNNKIAIFVPNDKYGVCFTIVFERSVSSVKSTDE